MHGTEGDSWRPDENEAGTFTCLKVQKIVLFYFFSFLVFSRCSAYKNEHRKRILGRQAAKSSQRAPQIFFSRPSSASQSFWIAFSWLSWTRSRIGWVLRSGKVCAFTFSVCRRCCSQRSSWAAHLEYILDSDWSTMRSAFHAQGPSLPLGRQCHYLHINIDQVPSKRDRPKSRLVAEVRAHSGVHFELGH